MTTNFQISEFLCHCCGQGADIIKPGLLEALQRVRNDWGKPMTIDDGYRCPKHNASPEVRGAPNSAHLTGEAADIADGDGALKAWMTEDMLAIYGLWAEDYSYTRTWMHVQIRPASKRIFRP